MKGRQLTLSPHASRGASGIWMFLGVVVLVLLLGGGCGVSKYNGMVADQEGVDKGWSEVLNAYQRRSELVPQLVATVKGAADFEQDTITAVTEARASVGRVQVPDSLAENPAAAREFLQAQDGLSSALSRLLVVAENYPTLQSPGAFRDLQSQLEGTENRIAVARRDYIQSVADYNTNVRKFPNSFIASYAGFERVPQYEPDDPDVSAVPDIDFGDE